MKWAILFLMAFVGIGLAGADEERKERIEVLYQAGIAAAAKGDLATAKAAFRGVLHEEPGHVRAKRSLRNLLQGRDEGGGARRKAQFAKVIVPRIDYNGAVLDEVLAHLAGVAEKDQLKLTPNFIVQDPQGKLAEKPIHLQLKKVPLAAVMRYLEDMVGFTTRYDQHATVIRPR